MAKSGRGLNQCINQISFVISFHLSWSIPLRKKKRKIDLSSYSLQECFRQTDDSFSVNRYTQNASFSQLSTQKERSKTNRTTTFLVRKSLKSVLWSQVLGNNRTCRTLCTMTAWKYFARNIFISAMSHFLMSHKLWVSNLWMMTVTVKWSNHQDCEWQHRI